MIQQFSPNYVNPPNWETSREVGTSTATNQQAISGEGHFGSIRAL